MTTALARRHLSVCWLGCTGRQPAASWSTAPSSPRWTRRTGVSVYRPDSRITPGSSSAFSAQLDWVCSPGSTTRPPRPLRSAAPAARRSPSWRRAASTRCWAASGAGPSSPVASGRSWRWPAPSSASSRCWWCSTSPPPPSTPPPSTRCSRGAPRRRVGGAAGRASP